MYFINTHQDKESGKMNSYKAVNYTSKICRQVYEGKIERVYRKFNAQLQQVRRDLSMNKPVGLTAMTGPGSGTFQLSQTKRDSFLDRMKADKENCLNVLK